MTLKYIAIPAGACFDPRVSPQHLRTLVIIAYYGSLSSREAYPSYNRLAQDVGISRRLLIGYIKHLCTCGYIVKKERLRPNGSKTSNVYHVPLNIELEPQDDELSPTTEVVKLGSTTPSDARQHLPGEAGQHLLNHTSLNKKKKNIKKSLSEWEQEVGSQLCADMMAQWIKENGYDRLKVSAAVTEFRGVMQANGNEYADFTAAFKNYINRGYLSVSVAALKIPSASPDGVRTFDKGLAL
jgi:hypothetical protein